VGAGAVIEHAVLADGVTVGPRARLGPGAVVGSGARVAGGANVPAGSRIAPGTLFAAKSAPDGRRFPPVPFADESRS